MAGPNVSSAKRFSVLRALVRSWRGGFTADERRELAALLLEDL